MGSSSCFSHWSVVYYITNTYFLFDFRFLTIFLKVTFNLPVQSIQIMLIFRSILSLGGKLLVVVAENNVVFAKHFPTCKFYSFLEII